MRKFVYLLSLIIYLPFSTAFAQEAFQAGKQYTIIGEAQPVETGDNIEVRELFWYGCPHCFKLEEPIDQWLENIPDGAQFVRMPAIFSRVWEQHAKLYYTLEAMGELDNMHQKVFDALHVKKLELVEDDDMADFVAEHGLDKDAFTETMESFSVTSKLNAAKTNIGKYQVTGVPAFVVGGKYLTDVSSAGSEANLFAVIEFLINKARAEN